MLCGKAVVRMIGAMLAVTILAGCSSTTRGQKMAESFEQTKTAVADAQRQVDSTLASLNHLRYTGDLARAAGGGAGSLSDAFTSLRVSVTRLEAQSESAKRRSAALKENVDANIAAWQKELESIHDPSVKAGLESRRDAVRANYKQIRMYADDARKAYEPFLRVNQDIIKALSLDLSPASISTLTPAIEDAMVKGRALQQRLAALELSLLNVERGVAPIGAS